MTGESPAARLTGLSVLRIPAHIRQRYRRFLLISHVAHVPGLDLAQTGTLVICTDWLAWRRIVDAGGHALHFEALMEHWPTSAEGGGEDPRDNYQASTRWMFLKGEDVTRFHGVSLGKQFLQDTSLFSKAYLRLWHGLDRLIARFRPDAIELIDLQLENHMLDDALKRHLVADLAARHGLTVTDRLAPPDPWDPLWPDSPHMGIELPETGWRPRLRRICSRAIDFAFRVVSPRAQARPKILVLNNWQVVDPLLRAFDSRKVTLVLPADHWPKNPRFLFQCWRRGIVLANLPALSLSAAERAGILALIERFEQHWREHPAEGIEAARRLFIRTRIFQGGWLLRRAAEANGYRALFRRHKFARVTVGDGGNALSRMIAETAWAAGIAAEELPNGMFLSDQRLDIRTGDDFGPAILTRFLAWGPQQEEWLRATGATIEVARCGYPGIDLVRRDTKVSAGRRKVLVLGPWIDGYDVIGLHSCKASYLVEMMQALQHLKAPDGSPVELRVKLHPGTPKKSYYVECLRSHGIGCEIHKEGRLTAHVEWADLVVGPASSGSVVETLAAGKPYYPVKHYPSMMADRYTDRMGAVESAAELFDLLNSGREPDREDILEYFCSFRTYPQAARRFWDLMEESVARA